MRQYNGFGGKMAISYRRSFLKWAGGKFTVLPKILEALPPGKRLVEPFVGSGVVFLNTNFDVYHLNDTNGDLIALYKTLVATPQLFIQYAAKYFEKKYNTAEKYYTLREKFNRLEDTTERSALFLYFNRHGYNGLCRYNQKGHFNVPFGRYEKPYFPAEEMFYFAKKAKHAIFTCQDFRKTMKTAKRGDVIYCDPPYVPLSTTASFTHYHHKKFSFEEQEALNSLAKTLQQKNIPVVISNHHTPYTEALYQEAEMTSFEVARFISCKGSQRRKVRELIVRYCK